MGNYIPHPIKDFQTYVESSASKTYEVVMNEADKGMANIAIKVIYSHLKLKVSIEFGQKEII